MTKRICVQVTAPCFIQGRERKPGEIFMVDAHLLDDPERLPSCLVRVKAEGSEYVEAAA